MLNSKMQIDCAIPAGNILVNHAEGFSASLNKDLRDTEGNWFYWKFRAVFSERGDYSFRFENGPAIGARGPAFSTDRGLSWNWLGLKSVSWNPDSFVYRFDGSPEHAEVWFCMGIPYLQENLDRFLEKKKGNPFLKRGVLCRSRKGREVELITVSGSLPEEDGEKIETRRKKKLLITSRHHCCEMMATYALEGILDAASEDSEFGKTFRSRFELYAVPFIDKDGVEDGDQGKFRRPRDHALDYCDEQIYPETAANMHLILEKKMDFILDLHCPWIHDGGNPEGTNERIFTVGTPSPEMEERQRRFGRILEKESPASAAPFRASDFIAYGTGWNGTNDYDPASQRPLPFWALKKAPFHPEFLSTLEIPYANIQEITLRPDAVREFGKAIARAIVLYDQDSGSPV